MEQIQGPDWYCNYCDKMVSHVDSKNGHHDEAKGGWFYFRFLHRRLMMLAHKNNWHHMTVSASPDSGLTFRCHWCGLDRVFPPGRLNEDALRNHKIVI